MLPVDWAALSTAVSGLVSDGRVLTIGELALGLWVFRGRWVFGSARLRAELKNGKMRQSIDHVAGGEG